jgi:hypothetical protein
LCPNKKEDKDKSFQIDFKESKELKVKYLPFWYDFELGRSKRTVKLVRTAKNEEEKSEISEYLIKQSSQDCLNKQTFLGK